MILGKTLKVLSLDKGIFARRIRWRWRRKYFGRAEIDLRRQMNPHIAILGQTGTGKSNACKLLLSGFAEKGIHLLVFDAHNEYVGMAEQLGAKTYDASRAGLNAFEIEGADTKEKAGEVSETLRRILRLGYRQYNELHKALVYMYDKCPLYGKRPGLGQLLYTIRIFKRHAPRPELSILSALETRLALLDTGKSIRELDLEAIMRGNTIFALSRLHTSEAQALFIESFLRRAYRAMLGSDKSSLPRLYIVVEEAEKLAESRVLSRLAAEGRKYGIGIIAISQRAKAIDREVRSNADLLIVFYQREPEELNYLANLIAGGNEYERFSEVKRALRCLGKGTALVMCSRREPSVVRFDAAKCPERNLGFEALGMSANGISGKELASRLSGMGFGEESIRSKVAQLLGSGELQSHDVCAGPSAGTWYVSSPRHSAEHDIMLRVISEKLSSEGVRHRVYDAAYMPDIVAYADGQRMAIEYETGKKEAADSERMLSRRKGIYPKVLVVANDACLESYLMMDGIDAVGASDFLESRGRISIKAHGGMGYG